MNPKELLSRDKDWLKRHSKEIPREIDVLERDRPRVGGKRLHFISLDEQVENQAGDTVPMEEMIWGQVQDAYWGDDDLELLGPEEYERLQDFLAEFQERREMLLTDREREVLELLREGLSQADIGRKLSITRPAVNKFVRNVAEKTRGLSTKHLIEPRTKPRPSLLETQKVDAKPRRRSKKG